MRGKKYCTGQRRLGENRISQLARTVGRYCVTLWSAGSLLSNDGRIQNIPERLAIHLDTICRSGYHAFMPRACEKNKQRLVQRLSGPVQFKKAPFIAFSGTELSVGWLETVYQCEIAYRIGLRRCRRGWSHSEFLSLYDSYRTRIDFTAKRLLTALVFLEKD